MSQRQTHRAGVGLDAATDTFLGLTPDVALDAVERAGVRCGNVCVPLNSFENRVYEIERQDAERTRLVAKFYRPRRWDAEQILAEHAYLGAAAAADIPVCDVLDLPSGGTLGKVGHIWFALFLLRRGRAPEDIDATLAFRAGGLAARLHNASAHVDATSRRALSADHLDDCIDELLERALVPQHLAARYEEAGREIAALLDERLDGVSMLPIHGDLHAGNLIQRAGVLHVLDFDDMMRGPAVQDLWLLLPSRDDDTRRMRSSFLRGYEQFRAFDMASLSLIEPLRGYRYITWARWLARRWRDPIFPQTWPDFGTETWWQSATSDLEDVLAHADQPTLWTASESVEDDGQPYFWDLEA